MTVEIEVDEKMWAEAESLAKDLNINYTEMFLNTLRENLYSLRDAKRKAVTIAEKNENTEKAMKNIQFSRMNFM